MRSIRKQLLLTLLPGFLVLSACAGVGLYVYMEEVLEHGLDAALAAKAQAIAGAVHLEDDGRPHLMISDAEASAATKYQSPFYFQIWRSDGTTLARLLPPNQPTAVMPRISANRHHPFANARLPDGTPVRITQLNFAPQPDADEFDPAPSATRPTVENLILVVAQDRRSVDGPLAILLTGLSVAACLMAVGIAVVVHWGVGRGLRPLAEVTRLADQIGPDALDVRFPSGDSVPAELRPIGSKLNSLLDRLDEAFSRERRFSAAVAHELRTPLAELRSACEVALKWPGDGRAATAALVDARDVAIQMTGTVRTLLALARSTATVDSTPKIPVVLADAVSAAWAVHAEAAHGRGLTIDVQKDSAAIASTDPAMLASVLSNVFGNVVAHARPNGRVRITATIDASIAPVIRVGNACDGLTAADVPFLCEPFWRKDAARAGNGSHVGLGLSLVQAYCRAMNVTVETKITDAEWFEVTLLFAAG